MQNNLFAQTNKRNNTTVCGNLFLVITTLNEITFDQQTIRGI